MTTSNNCTNNGRFNDDDDDDDEGDGNAVMSCFSALRLLIATAKYLMMITLC